MEKVNIKRLYAAIKIICTKAPITYISESLIIFRGESLEIKGNKAKTNRFEFTFNSHKSFIKNLRNYGLMLSQLEYYKIIQEYGIKNTEQHQFE